MNWQAVFEHPGGIATNPILADPKTFMAFCREYTVVRTISKGTHDALRLELFRSTEFQGAIRENSAGALDELAKNLRRQFGTRKADKAAKSVVSTLSKVAAFLKPAYFVA